ncbi:MAG: hypothetical protein AAF411_22635 [Myxococcota bacterium]
MRPDSIFRCEIEYDSAAISDAFPPGVYDIWVGRPEDGPSTYELRIQAEGPED